MVTDPNAGSHTVEQWVSPAAFHRLDPTTQAGQFGNAGRNIVRGPGQSVLDSSVLKRWPVTESSSVQLRFEAFNVLNHANFLIPINDMASQNFGRITQASAPRVFQLGLKFLF